LQFDINYLAVLVAGISNMVVGFLWYGPLFGKPWIKEMGWENKSPEEMEAMKSKMMPMYAKSFIGALLMAYVFAHVLKAFAMAMGQSGAAEALQGALWMWLGFIVPVLYGKVLWEGKSHKLYFIDVFYYLVTLSAMALILVLWK
jgi:hypothetical protein